MTPRSDIIPELRIAANTILYVDPLDRQRLLLSGIDEVASLGNLLRLAGHSDGELPPFMNDMSNLAAMARSSDAVEVLVAAGMSMLAGEIERLRDLLEKIANQKVEAQPTLAEALRNSGFEPSRGGRHVVEERSNREPLRRRGDAAT